MAEERQSAEEALRQIAAELHHLRKEELPKLQPKAEAREQERRTRRVVYAAVAIVLVVGALGWMFRHQDQQAASRQAVHDRAALIAGCERANDQRATLREIITTAIATQPVPVGLSPELSDLLRQSQLRAEALRSNLLALPGVQPVDCDKAFPIVGKEQT